MAKMIFDEEGLLEEPCLSCDKAYTEDLWYEWCCDEKDCPHKAESEGQGMTELFEYILIALACPLVLPFIDEYKVESEVNNADSD